MQSKAVLRMARISPQRARLVADMIRGKYASEAEKCSVYPKKLQSSLGLLES